MTNLDFKKMDLINSARDKFAEDFLLYFYKKGLIENDDLKLKEEIKVKLINSYTFFGKNPEKLSEQKTKIEKELIISQNKRRIKEAKSEIIINNPEVIKMKLDLYKKLSINNETYKNSDSLKFTKGFIDVSLLQNADLIMYLKDNGTDLFVKIFEEISKMELLDIIKIFGGLISSIGESVKNLFVGNSYERGKSVAELGLSSAVILILGKKILKKQAIKEIKSDTLKISPILIENQNKFRENIIEILNSDKNIKKIEIPNDRKTKEIINSIVSENYPLIEVMRLIPGETVTNITFSGIKKLNDNLGQSFTDKLLGKLQENIKNNFKENTSGIKESSRIIRTNYKNLTFSSPEIDSKKVFFEGKNKDEVISNLILNLNTDIEIIAKKLGKNPKDLEILIKENLDFSIGESILKKGATDKEKLKVFYEAEISSREGIGKVQVDSTKFDLKNIEKHSRKAKNIEKIIIEKFNNKSFEFNNIKYKTIIKDIDGDITINPILLRYVRKYGENGLVKPIELNELTKVYINELNSGFDFISPSINLEKDLIIASKINQGIHKGVLDIDDIIYTYKGTLSKESFFEITKGKSGMNAFIDIKDMGIDNLNEFKILGDKLLDGKLSEDELLKAGNKVTQKFIKTVNDFKKIYGDKIKISLGGDEIYVFIEGVTKTRESEILLSINKIMNNNNLKSRISHNFDDGKIIDKKSEFYNLDKLTKINKAIEEKIEGLTYKTNTHSILKIPDNISLNIEKGLENIALVNIDNIISSILQKIDTNILRFIERPMNGNILDLGEIEGVRVILKGQTESLMEININKI